MKKSLFITLIFIFNFLFNCMPISFAAENIVDPRETAIDRAIGGMEEGSRPLEPQGYAGKTQTRPIPGGNLSPSADTRVTASAPAQNIAGSSSIGNGANLSGNTNVGTESGSTQGGSAEGTVGGGTGGTTEPTTEEPASGGSTDSSIIEADANVDLSGESPTVDANLAVDTNAGTLLDADVSAATDTTSTDITATESGTVAGEDLSTAINEAPVDATLDTEVVATDIPTDSEATAGLEADVDPVTADSDVAPTDPADGLSTTTL